MNSEANTNKMSDDRWENLRAAIVLQAVKDYRKARKEKNYSRKRSIKKFLLSDWGQALSYGKGQYIIDRLEKEPIKKKRNAARHVICVETGVEYNSIGAAAKEYGETGHRVYDSCTSGRALKSAGVHFKYKDGEKSES